MEEKRKIEIDSKIRWIVGQVLSEGFSRYRTLSLAYEGVRDNKLPIASGMMR